jgi:DinB superfamily
MARQLLTLEQILSILRDTPDRLSRLTGDLTEAELHAAPEPGEWSVTGIVAHLRSCSDVWGAAIETIAGTDHPTIRAVSPTTWIERTDYRELAYASTLQAFRKQRDQLLALLGQLPDQAWSRSATVVGGGRPLELTVHSYASRLARHERTHWRQVAKTVRAVALAGTGRPDS